MLVHNVQERDDKTLVFTGTLTAPEVEVVVSFGINTLMSLGLAHLLPSIETNEIPTGSIN